MFRPSPLFLIFLFLAACTAVKPTTTTTVANIPTIDSSELRISQIRSWMQSQSRLAHSLLASGSISVDQNGAANSANFTLRSKRLDESVTTRVDSLSVEVTGPFGITVARFMASPEEFQMNDIMHGDTRRGRTDPKSLEGLTHLNGITVSMMNDLVYGLTPGGDTYSPMDSLMLFATGTEHAIVIYRKEQNATEMVSLAGELPDTDGTLSIHPLYVLGYERWNGMIEDPIRSGIKPAVSIQYGERAMVDGFSLPQHTEAHSGENTLVLDYADTHMNPNDLTVRIKMPK